MKEPIHDLKERPKERENKRKRKFTKRKNAQLFNCPF